MSDHAYRLSEMWANVQKTLFPFLEEEFEGSLSESHRDVVWAMEVVRLERHLPSEAGWRRIGAPRKDRKRIAAAFLAKAVTNLPTTKAMRERLLIDAPLRRICGWERRKDVPSEATFSRAFAEFAETGLLDKIHEALAKRHLEDAVVWNVARDATAIVAREKPARSEKAVEAEKASTDESVSTEASAEAAETTEASAEETKKPARRKRGRPRKGEVVAPPEPTRIERQRTQSLEEALAELPRRCDVGTKKNSKGYKETWIGYKLHVDVNEDGIPISALTTSASLHDSQAAIPLHRLTRERAGTVFYELMDAAYDAAGIKAEIAEAGSVSIIDPNPRRGPTPPPMEKDRARIYDGRSAAERFNSDLKDNHGGRTLRVRGGAKAHAHLMFGLLAIFARTLLGRLG